MAVVFQVLIVACVFTLCACAEFTYYYNIKEELPPAHSTFIGNIPNDTNLQSMVSEEDFSNLQYSFLTEGDSQTVKHFSLDENTGNLGTAPMEVLDRETLCPFASNCKLSLEIAIKSKLNQFFRTVALEIIIEDINDNSPTFATNKTSLNISEGVVSGASFPLEGAVDRDTGVNNSLQTYTIRPSDGSFGIQFTKNLDGTSYLNLLVNEKLDHEKQNFYNFQIIAEDGGSPPKTGILIVEINVIDMNDNKPNFTQESYSIVVGENVTQNSVILTVTATDADSGENGEVRYSLSRHQAAKNLKLFSIDAKTGDLLVIGNLQTEIEEKYDIIVEASDSGQQPFTKQTVVTVNVLDTINSPPRVRVNLLSNIFLNYSSISEYANLGVVVAHVRVYESDRGRNGIVNCELAQHDYFELQGFDVNEYKVIVAKPLDRETMPQHTVTVVCQDAGTPQLNVNSSFIVKVTDENDNDPQFSSSIYSTSIPENNKIGASVLTVMASDLDEGNNALIRYTIYSDKDEFIISPEDGVIIANTNFDYETRPVMNFSVIAVDAGDPARSSIAKVTVRVIDVNDEKPTFSHSVFQFNISENAKPGQSVGHIAAYDFESGPNGEVYIVLASGINNIEPFVLFHNGTVILNGSVDFETKKQYEFQVTAVDRGDPPLNTTTYVRISILDENDNVPIIVYPNITHHSIKVNTDYKVGNIITSVQAKDGDTGRNAQLKYIITSRNDSGRFEINAKTGEMLISKQLGGKDVNMYKLMIMVQDEGIPPYASHTILLINVVAGNGSSLFGGQGDNDQNVLITVTIICVTAVVSAIIVLVIIVMKRKDKQRSKVPEGPKYLQNPGSLTQYVDKVKVDSVRTKKGTENAGDEEFGFSSNKKDKEIESMKSDVKSQQYSLAKETTDEKDGRMDQLTVLQLHQALLQSYQDHQLSNSQVAAWQRGQDDVHSDASGETTTSDSGRGGSEEDICSHSGVSASQIEDLHELSRDTLLNNTSFQSSQTIPSSLKSGLKDVRTSVRKHVTFRDLSDKGRTENYQEFSQIGQQSKHHPQIKNMDRNYPPNPGPKPPPRGSQSCGFTVRNPTFSNDSKFHHGSAKNPMGDFHLPVQDHISHVRDWRNDSIATTEDGDDRSTTTSGSYTIDNEDGITLDYNDFRDVVV